METVLLTGSGERNFKKSISLSIHACVCIHARSLIDVTDDAVDLSNACGFSSSFHTLWSKSSEPESHDRLSEKISRDLAAYYLPDMQIRVRALC